MGVVSFHVSKSIVRASIGVGGCNQLLLGGVIFGGNGHEWSSFRQTWWAWPEFVGVVTASAGPSGSGYTEWLELSAGVDGRGHYFFAGVDGRG